MKPIKTVIVSALVIFVVAGVSGSEMTQSVFEKELLRTRYDLTDASASGEFAFSDVEDEADLPLSAFAQTEDVALAYRSPTRAFLYSLVVPGLGQYYYGSKIKPVIFLAAEVVIWSQALKYHSDANDLRDEYRDFNDTCWSKDHYLTFLDKNYGTYRPDTLKKADDSVPTEREIIEVLPSSKSQQYYEMTGKYNQFAWGWRDAILDGKGWEHYTWEGVDHPGRIVDSSTTPTSKNRDTYEDMRHHTNSVYSKSMNFVFAIMGNHLISAFEAYFVTKHHNNVLRHEQEFARVKVETQLRSYSAWKDTPYVTISYKF